MQVSTFVSAFLALAGFVSAQSLSSGFSNSSSSDDLTTTIRITSQLTSTVTVPNSITSGPNPSYTTTTVYSIVNLTSITSYITVYPTDRSTSVTTNIYTTNATFEFTRGLRGNPAALYSNFGGGAQPSQVSEFVNATEIVTHGVTIASPSAFWIYDKVRIVTADAVTDSDGQVVCGTPSSNGTPFITTGVSITRVSSVYMTSPRTTVTATDILYSTSSGGLLIPITTVTNTNLVISATLYTESTVTLATFVTTVTPYVYDPVNANAEALFDNGTPTGTEIPLITPFIYIPDRGDLKQTTDDLTGVNCQSAPNLVDYGYPPQALISYLGANAPYNTEYAGIGTYLPGGASILPQSNCSIAAPEVLTTGGDLTSSTTIFITPTAALPEPVTSNEPSPSPTTTPPSPTPTTSPTSEPEPTTSPDTQPPASTPATSELTSAETSELTPQPNPATSGPATQPGPVNSEQPPGTTQVGVPPNATPSQGEPAQGPSSGAGSPQATASQDIGSAIASVIGASPVSGVTTIISGSTGVIVSGLATVPVSAVSPGASGETIVINGGTQVIIPTLSTVPLSAAATQALPGSITEISGTQNVVISGSTIIPVNSQLPGLSGSTTVISASTYVVVWNPTTIPVVPIAPTGSNGNSSANTTAPLQATGVASNTVAVPWNLIFSGILGLIVLREF